MSDPIIWPDLPINAGPDLRTGDSVIVVRVQADTARWLYSLDPSDITLGRIAGEVLRKAAESAKEPA